MGGQTISTSQTRAEALQVQSSVRGACIPWVRGRTQISGNLLWANGFTAVAHTESEGGKGGATVRNTSYTYHIDAMMGLCHGPIIGIPTVWRGKGINSGGVTASQIETTAAEAWTVPASGAMTRTLTHASVFLCIIGITVDASGMLLAQGKHYTASAAGVVTVLDEELRGVMLRIAYQWRSSTINHTALAAMGLSFIAGHIGQAAWSGLAGYPDESIGYSGLAAVAGQDYDLGSAASFENHKFEVVAPMAYHLGDAQPDIDPALFCRELMVDVRAGASFPSEHLGTWSAWSDYCVAAGLLVSPRLTEQTTAAQVLEMAAELTNSAISASSGKVEMIPYADQSETGNGRTFTPDLTPVYDLDDECWTPGNGGESPLKYRLKSNADRYNHWRLDYANRANQYESEPAEAKDDADIQARGLRTNPSSVNAADWVCSGATARKAVQVMMQRSISVLGEFEAPLPWHFALLDLMDVVTLTDETLELDRMPARVIAIEENEEGDLTFTFEDCPIGAASAAVYGAPDGDGFVPDFNVDPGDVDAPLIFEGPAQLAGNTGIEVYVAVRGTDPNWGGAHIWTSLDGSNYRLIGTVNGAARYGLLSAAMTTGSTSLGVDGLGLAQLLSGSADDAQQLVTLCFVGGTDGEFLAYETATLTGAGAYTLGGLVRGAYGSPSAAHANNSPFCRIDDRVARSGPLEPSMVGQSLFIKCTSFNIFGAGTQSLADVSAIAYTVTGQPASYYPGIGGKAVLLRASSLAFQYPKAGGVNPSSITFTAERKGGLEGAAVYSVVAGTATLTGSGDTRTLTAANLSTDSATIRVSVTDAVATYTYDQTVIKVREGQDGDGNDGLNSATVFIYRRSATTPALPSATVTYTFATGVATGLNNGWTQGIPSGSDPLWVAVASAISTGTTDTIAAGEWADPVKLAENGNDGLDGLNSATVFIYRRTTTNSAPALPSATVTYTFSTGVATGLNNSWTQTVPTSGGAYLWISTATAASTGATDSITSGQWAAANLMAADGADGANAPLLKLELNTDKFTFDGAGAASPTSQTISATAMLTNLSGTATFVCTRYDISGSSLGTVTMGGSGNTRTLTVAQFGAAAYADIEATLSGVSDRERVVRLKDGADAIVSDLTNDSHTLPADSDGNVTSYTGAETRMVVSNGLSDDSANWTFGRANGTGVTSALGTGADKNLLTVTALSAGTDSSYVDITATRSGYLTQTKRFTLAKSRSAPGSNGLMAGANFFSFDMEVPPSTESALAQVTLFGDGSVQRLMNDSVVSDSDWYTPPTSGIGNGYWVRAVASGTNAGEVSGSLGTWVQLNTSRAWSLALNNPNTGEKDADVVLTFATDSSGATVVGQMRIGLGAHRPL